MAGRKHPASNEAAHTRPPPNSALATGDAADHEAITIRGLGWALGQRLHGPDPDRIEFVIDSARRRFRVVIADEDIYCRTAGIKPPLPEFRWRALAACPELSPYARALAYRGAFLPLPRAEHPTLDAALSAVLQGVLLDSTWSLEDWEQELAWRRQQYAQRSRDWVSHRIATDWIDALDRWVAILDLMDFVHLLDRERTGADGHPPPHLGCP